MRSEPRVCESSAAEAAVILLSDRQPDLRRRGEDHQWSGGQTRGLALAGGDQGYKERLKTVGGAANLFQSFRHMSAFLALETINLQLLT